MKQIRRKVSSGLFTLPFLSLVCVLVAAASYVLASGSFEGIFQATLFNTPQGILLLVLGPLALLIFLGIFLYGIIADSLRHGERNRLRFRFFLIFCAAILAATLPQAVIIGRFVNTAVDTWFSRDISDSLISAEHIAALYTAERRQSIEKVGERFLNGLAITNYRARPSDWMGSIRDIDPHAVACQVYQLSADFASAAWLPVVETGDSGQFVPRDKLGTVINGFFILTPGEDVYRYGQIVRYSGLTYVCVFTSMFPAGFDARRAAIRSSFLQTLVIDKLKPFLPVMGLWVYILFALPSILTVIILGWFISARIAEPVRSLAEATARLAEGDDSLRLIPHSRDEVGEAGTNYNAIAEQHGAKKRPDKKAVLRL